MNDNYANQIVSNLEAKGESKDFIIGFLTATLNGVKYLDKPSQIEAYLKRSVEQAAKDY